MIDATKASDLRMYSATTNVTSASTKHQQLKEATQAFEALFMQSFTEMRARSAKR